jgi:hypothetical protein
MGVFVVMKEKFKEYVWWVISIGFITLLLSAYLPFLLIPASLALGCIWMVGPYLYLDKLYEDKRVSFTQRNLLAVFGVPVLQWGLIFLLAYLN